MLAPVTPEPSMRRSPFVTAATLSLLPVLQAGAAPPPVADGRPAIPATFGGDLPCPECAAVRWHLDLLEGDGYELRREWVGRERRRDEVGRWRYDPARSVIVLYGAAEMPLDLEVLGPDRLRVVDTVGPGTGPPSSRVLVSDGALHPVDLSLALGGEMTYLADAAAFTECMTGRTYPVAMEGDYLALERAYLAAVGAPGAPLYVTFDGTLAARPRMEGEGTERTVIVDRYINVWPGERCERAAAHASLSNTYWRIVRLRGEAVAATDGRREPHLIFREGDGRTDYTATVGCSTRNGSYSVDAEALHFGAASVTAEPCPAQLRAADGTLAEVLDSAARWRINANTLELFDASGAPLALLEAVYLK